MEELCGLRHKPGCALQAEGIDGERYQAGPGSLRWGQWGADPPPVIIQRRNVSGGGNAEWQLWASPARYIHPM